MDRIRVGSFELYPSERILSAAGKQQELGARAFDLLLVLVENHGRLVTKATLLEQVWPRLVVDENNLPTQIASLRRVFGAGAIRTIPGFGYRLELEVSAPESADAAPAAKAAQDDFSLSQLSVPRFVSPGRLVPLVGRKDELREVEEALDQSCFVTIVGIAGVGKTRLAQEIHSRRAESGATTVAWVSLEPIGEIQRVPSAVALALGLALPDRLDGFTALRQALEKIPLLLIIDGVEHLSDALAEPLAGLVMQTQGLRVLVTSQVPLGITGETVYRLPALQVPDAATSSAEAADCGAVAMFAQRAAAADRRFSLSEANIALVVEICRRLDGIPLALELAAARTSSLGLGTLLTRLEDRFRLLKPGGRPADSRHDALLAAFDWSYGLLTAPEQHVFNRLGAFAGSFSLETAARCVAGADIDTTEAMDLIGRLVDRSLVTSLAVEPSRYDLLETARYYALERLGAIDQLEVARARMAAAMLDVLDDAYREYWSLDEADWLHRYEPELDNVRAAIHWAADHDGSLCISLFGSAWPLLVETDLHAEGRAGFTQAVALLSDVLPRARVGRFWEAIATYESFRQYDRASYAAELAATMHAANGDTRSQYYALMLLTLNWRGDADAARAAFEAARRLENPAWPQRLLTQGAFTEGALMMGDGRFSEARAAYLRALKLALTTSERQALAATVNIVELDIATGDTSAALQLGRPLALSLQHLGRRETRFELLILIFSALLIAGEADEARATGAELYELAKRLDASKLYTALDAMALLACNDRRYEEAMRIAISSDAAHEAHGQASRRPAEARVRAAVEGVLHENLGTRWRDAGGNQNDQLDEVSACALALGLSV